MKTWKVWLLGFFAGVLVCGTLIAACSSANLSEIGVAPAEGAYPYPSGGITVVSRDLIGDMGAYVVDVGDPIQPSVVRRCIMVMVQSASSNRMVAIECLD